MNFENVVFSFFIVLALTLNFGFFIGDIDNPVHHNQYELLAAILVNLIATILKFGDKSHVGAILLSTSLVADMQLLLAGGIWIFGVHITGETMTPNTMVSIVSLAGGAMLANVISVLLLVTETVLLRR
ncbi:DUF6394 family protein [Candidatus Venteria ishoeyi]|uniref:Uncharacterized protein n=1 Tax=Candidatus Venteria ishoeyi TaxID=1899563 RepID=A0A1H6F4S2_9GAMM|nr:DUF6394 family protein [Candidatus Venteria ishoeyi]MDM8546209.1 DUF6394 family protein [Candidatus Venteria ishoeyi]SEH04371.1 Uncharacterised protein [Candidatus Venteria ishoeyi]